MTGAPSGSDALFAYGTLSVPEVLEALIGARPPSCPATLEDHSCYRVRGEVFPAALERAGTSTGGVLYEGIPPAAWTLLDRFEGALYERRLCRIRTTGGDPRDAFAYLLAAGRERVLSREGWSADEFAARHLDPYVAACRAFRAAHAPG